MDRSMPKRVRGDGDAVDKDAEVATAGVTASAQDSNPWCGRRLDTAFNALRFHRHGIDLQAMLSQTHKRRNAAKGSPCMARSCRDLITNARRLRVGEMEGDVGSG